MGLCKITNVQGCSLKDTQLFVVEMNGFYNTPSISLIERF